MKPQNKHFASLSLSLPCFPFGSPSVVVAATSHPTPDGRAKRLLCFYQTNSKLVCQLFMTEYDIASPESRMSGRLALHAWALVSASVSDRFLYKNNENAARRHRTPWGRRPRGQTPCMLLLQSSLPLPTPPHSN